MVETKWISAIQIISKKVVETTRIFWPLKLHRKEYVKTAQIFRPAKLRQKKYVERTWIFRLTKLHQRSMWKWRANSSKFGLSNIDVISTSNRHGFDMVSRWGFITPERLKQLLKRVILTMHFYQSIGALYETYKKIFWKRLRLSYWFSRWFN